MINAYVCPRCGSENFVNEYENNSYCLDCCNYFIMTYRGTFKKYKQMNNLKKILLNYTGKSLITISKEVKEKLKETVENKEYTNELYNKCKKILIDNKLKKNINEINVIYYVVNKKPPLNLNFDQERQVIKYFFKIFSLFGLVRSKYKRKNFIKIDFILGKVLEHMKINHNILRPLKRKSTKQLYENIWNEISAQVF